MKVSLAAMRVHRKMTQKNAAKRLDVDVSTLRRWENGQSAPDYDQLMDVCRLYDCQLGDLILSKKSA